MNIEVTDYEAVLRHLEPGEGTARSADEVHAALKAKGVRYGLMPEVIEETVRQVNESKEAVGGIVVARGVEPVAAIASHVELSFRVAGKDPFELAPADKQRAERAGKLALDLVVQGDVIACKVASAKGVAGKTVRGDTTLAPPGKTRVVAVKAGAGVQLDRDKGEYTVTTAAGYVDLDGDKLTVRPLIAVSADSMIATMTLFPTNAGSRRLDAQVIEDALVAHKIVHGVDQEAITKALDQLKSNPVFGLKIEVAHGTAPQAETLGFIEWLVRREAVATAEGKGGRVDYRERATIVNVTAGTPLAKLHPPTAGQPGVSILGEQLPMASAAKSGVLKAGENVQLDPDTGIFAATADGILFVLNDIVNVSLAYGVDQVDLKSGNLRSDAGAVSIRHSVQSNMVVQARGHIVVGESVEDAVIESGGDIDIMGGVMHGATGRIVAGGDVKIGFAQNARIVAGGDISIRSSAMNAELNAGGKILVIQGKGLVIGGTLRAVAGIEVRELGSAIGVTTHVFIGPEATSPDLLAKQVAQIDDELAANPTTSERPFRFERVTGLGAKAHGILRGILQDGNDNDASTAYLERIQHEGIAAREKFMGSLSIHSAIHPGVHLSIVGLALIIGEPRGRCRFVIDHEKKIIAEVPFR